MIVNVKNVAPPIDSNITREAKAPQPELNLPNSGKKAPPPGNDQPPQRPEPPPVDAQKVVEQIAEFVSNNARGIRFRVDDSSGRTIVTVVNTTSGETIRQMPTEEFLRVAAALKRTGDLRILDDQA